MGSPLKSLLAQLRDASKTEREKGTYFERLALVFLKNDPGMQQEYEDAWDYATWAKMQGLPATDNGIDAVAKIRGEDSYCAIQCKFYGEGRSIPKSELDKFLSTLGAMRQFSRGLIIETTGRPFSENASVLFDDLSVTTIDLDRLEESPINWQAYFVEGEIKVEPPKTLLPHQQQALEAVREGLVEADRGKLIMACGTGKTFTGLKIAEDLVGTGGTVLVLVPSLALMSQTIREWTIDSQTPLRSYAVCSDSQVGKRRRSKDDVAEVDLHDLDIPATTKAAKLASRSSYKAHDRMTVVFSTYQSIQVLSDAQKLHNFPEFDLIICDEAHRTTGVTLADEDESNFVKVHDQDFIAGKKRLYMTATPRVFGEAAKAKANEASAELADMNNEAQFGKELFVRGFGWAVENGLLTDYKVIVLAVDEAMVSASVQARLKDADSSLVLDDATKIIGCYKALIKSGLRQELVTDHKPMQRALAFCKDIDSSKIVSSEFRAVVEEYLASDEGKEALGGIEPLTCELQHVDGTMGARERTQKLDWLKERHDDAICRILSNVRCLSEGVDVPALDAILFMHPRKSQIDVVQSVGRVMRRAPGKNMGYVILPIGVPAGMTPQEALSDNERYRVVWQILNALRAHDERFDAMINKADLGVDVSHHIEVVAVSNKLPASRDKAKAAGIGDGAGADDGEHDAGDSTPRPKTPFQGSFVFDEFSRAIMAKIVKKCGRREYWEDWANDIAAIAQRHISRIKGIVEKPGTMERAAFDAFLTEIRDDLNPEVSEGEAMEMLAQHLITRPVLEALFEDYSFSKNNPVSKAMQSVLEALDEHAIGREAEKLEGFYASVRRRAAGIDNPEAKQKIIIELYDKFFQNAFPKLRDRLGIVYTPVEVVDFIIHSVNEVLQSEFGQTLGSQGVHILDPFTGTGTFITRLLQSGLIKREELEHKYRNEIHANEMVLLAYYIAAINIEAAYHGVADGDYVPFEGICLTDTFQLYEQERDMISDLMADNSDRRTRQKELDIRVIVGNPPYSVGQSSANDNAANIKYDNLDHRIAETYAARSAAKLKNSLYNSYVRAIRWASDRIGEAGTIAFISGSGFLDKPAMDGIRKCLADEFSSIYVINLRGDIRKNILSKGRAREGQNIFESGSMSGVAISLLVKNPSKAGRTQIRYFDIGNDLSTQQKRTALGRFASLAGVEQTENWQSIQPDQHGDWLSLRDKAFDQYMPLGSKGKGQTKSMFSVYSGGLKTNRDNWAYNSSAKALASHMQSMIGAYNSQLEDFKVSHTKLAVKDQERAIEDFIETDPTKIRWTRGLKNELSKGRRFVYEGRALTVSLYRPFLAQWLYYDRAFNEMILQMPRIFPVGNADADNRVIVVSGVGARTGFSSLLVKSVPDQHALDTCQCFPRWFYEKPAKEHEGELNLAGSASTPLPERKDAITEAASAYFQSAYPGETITKDDLFYYVYGLLHSEDYRSRFADNLSKQLPRIPAVKKAADFWAFVEAGRKLGDLHCEYEQVEPYPVTIAQGDLRLANIADPKKFYRVEKMKFAGKRPNLDKTTVIYNSNITMTGIPLEAYDYVVNGKPALEWVMERQCVKTDKASGIVNDANRYAVETAGDPAYPLKLFQRVITVSLETMKIVRGLPKLEID